MNLRPFRIASQVLTFSAFIVLLLLAKYPLHTALPYPIFLRIDPLISLTTMLAARTVIAVGMAGVVMLVFTALIGRYFCAWICPLGTTIDLFDRLVTSKYRTKKNQRDGRFRQIKYYVLAAVAVAALFGVNMVFWFDPIAIVTRLYTVTVIPLLNAAGNMGLGWFRAVAGTMDIDSDLLYHSFRHYYFMGTFGTLLLFGLILGFNLYQSRFWCRNVCPLGALLGLASRFALFKRITTDGCNTCQRCRIICPMGAIDEDCYTTITPECTLCGNCGADCSNQMIAFSPAPHKRDDHITGLNMSRRGFVQTAGLAVAGTVAARSGLRAKVINESVVRPPGSLPEDEFLNRCVRCGECMKACKTNCLQPAFMESGFTAMFSPKGVFRIAGCEKSCNNCGQVCPTGAIRPLSLEEKQYAKMGTAVINRRRCIAWEQNQLCLICDEICPYDAIEYRVVDEFNTGAQKSPFVIEEKCVGCGMCEQKCPVRGKAAIYVTSEGEERMSGGSYITPRKKKLREIENKQFETDGIIGSGDNKQPAGFLGEEPAEKAPSGFLGDDPAPKKAPAGFLSDDPAPKKAAGGFLPDD